MRNKVIIKMVVSGNFEAVLKSVISVLFTSDLPVISVVCMSDVSVHTSFTPKQIFEF
jgi:hypothetical protein